MTRSAEAESRAPPGRLLRADPSPVLRDHRAALWRISATTSSSPRQLERAFRTCGNTTFRVELTRVRLTEAARLLSTQPLVVRDVAHSVGFRQAPHFCKAFKQAFGMSPGAYRDRAIRHRRQA